MPYKSNIFQNSSISYTNKFVKQQYKRNKKNRQYHAVRPAWEELLLACTPLLINFDIDTAQAATTNLTSSAERWGLNELII